MQRGYLKQMQVLFVAITISPMIFMATVLFMQNGEQQVETNYEHPLVYAAVIASTFLLIGSNLIYRFRTPALKQKEILAQKLEGWRSIFIMRVAMIEAAALINLVFLFTTGFDLFLYLAVAIIVYQFINLPSRSKIKNELDLNEEEASSL